PAGSDCCAGAVWVPSAKAGDAVTDQDPFAARVAPTLSTGAPATLVPLYTFTVIEVESPPAVPPVPEKSGVLSFVELPAVGLVSEMAGGVASTVNVAAPLDPVLPTASDCSA